MSSSAAAQPLGGPHEEPAPAPSEEELKARSIGVTSATGLMIGSIIGTGVFAMPAEYLVGGCFTAITRCSPEPGSSPTSATTTPATWAPTT